MGKKVSAEARSASLWINILGPLEVRRQTGELLNISSPTLRLLLGYLALNHDAPIERRRLANSIWPDAPAVVARRNLREYLYRARQALSIVEIDEGSHPLYLDGHIARLDTHSSLLEVDIALFNSALSSPDTPLNELERAAQLYRGDLLADLDADWITLQREHYLLSVQRLLGRLIDAYTALRDYESALRHAQRLVELHPYLDEAYARLMTLLYETGQRARALQIYREYEALLENEVAAGPIPELQALYASMRQGAFASPASGHLAPALAPVFPVLGGTLETPPDYVGRERELQAALHIIQKPVVGGSYIIIRGESGIGKSRFMREICQRLGDQTLIFEAQAHEFDPTALRPIRDVIRSRSEWISRIRGRSEPWLASVIQLVPELAARFPRREDPASVPQNLERIFIDLANLFHWMAKNQPLILALDDMQWADEATWQFLLTLQSWREDVPLHVILSYRQGEGKLIGQLGIARRLERTSTLLVELNPLLPEQTAHLAQQVLTPLTVDQMHMRRLIQDTEGNPFFVIEYAHALRERLPLDSANWIDVPTTVQNLVEERIERLLPGHQHLLCTASVINHPFSIELLTQIEETSAAVVVEVLDNCLMRGLLVERDEGYDFGHNIIRSVCYQRLTRPRRALIHRKVADAFSSDRFGRMDDSELAYHYTQSDQPEKAIVHTINACQRALQLRAYDDVRRMGIHAVQQLSRLQSDTHSTQQRIDLELHLALAYSYTGEPGRALPLLQTLESLARNLEDDARLAKVCQALSNYYWLVGQAEQAQRYARIVYDHAGDDLNLSLSSLRMLGRTMILLSAYDEAIVQLRKYLKLAQADVPAQRAIVQGYLGVAYVYIGSWTRAMEAAEAGVELARQVDNTATLTAANLQLMFVHSERRNWDTCHEIGAAFMPSLEEPLSPTTFMLAALMGRAKMYLKQDGIPELHRAIGWAERAQYRVRHYVPVLWLAEAELMQGHSLAALEAAQNALKLSNQAGDRWAKALALRLCAEANSRSPSPDWVLIEANLIQSAALLRQIRARPDLARTYLLLRRLYDRAGRTAWAIDCHYRATQIFDELNMLDELRQAQGRSEPGSITTGIGSHVPLVGPHWQL